LDVWGEVVVRLGSGWRESCCVLEFLEWGNLHGLGMVLDL
jgi:hypothetical protein